MLRTSTLILLGSLSPGRTTVATPQDRLAPLVDGILAAWRSADVVCLGEDHGRQHDSDLRIALIRHPKFAATVKLVVVEFANPVHNTLLDRFILEGAELSHDELAVVWRDASGAETWESPIYEKFLRAIREMNLRLPRAERVRVIGGDTYVDWKAIRTPEDLAPLLAAGLTNRGGNIRKLIAEEVLEKKVKALAIYGAGHCVNIGMGFPGELADRYPGRIWSVYGEVGEQQGARARDVFELGPGPAYVVVKGTRWATLPAAGLLLTRRKETMGDMLDAYLHFGEGVRDEVVRPADPGELRRKYGAELDRRGRLLDAALARQRRR